MADSVPTSTSTLLPAADLALSLVLQTAPNGIRYVAFGETRIGDAELERVVAAVPKAMTPALTGRAFYFVPLTLPASLSEVPTRKDAHRSSPEQTLVAAAYTAELADQAICHRNVSVPASGSTPAHEGVFISARLLRDQFALAFEFFINVGNAFAAEAGIPEGFAVLAWSQAKTDVRGETSHDAWESRSAALAVPARPDEKAKAEFLNIAFADAVAIYLLSLAVDFDYAELREREYPLLAPNSLADRLRLVAKLFPPNPGYEFSIRYRRRG